MGSGISDFLGDLGDRGHEPVLARTSGRVCVHVVDEEGADERRLVCIDDGNIDLVVGDIGADCTLHGSRDTLDRIARGEMNAMAAALRGAITIDGDWGLLVRFHRVFPAPSDQVREPAASAAAT